VSPLWRDRLIVNLAPEQLTVVRLGAGFRPRPIRQYAAQLDVDSTTPWRPALTAFNELIDDAQWKTTGIEIVLSSHFVRYAVIPGDPSLRNARERDALGGIIFRKAFGNLCQDWQITISGGQLGSAALGAATPSKLLDELSTGIGRRARIHSIKPDLMEAFNRINNPLARSQAVIALFEPGKATIAQVADGAWKSIASRIIPPDDPSAFTRVLQEESVLRPFTDGTSLWVRDLTGTAAIPDALAGRVRTIPTRWPGHAAGSLLA
jgi:hypothetical protein